MRIFNQVFHSRSNRLNSEERRFISRGLGDWGLSFAQLCHRFSKGFAHTTLVYSSIYKQKSVELSSVPHIDSHASRSGTCIWLAQKIRAGPQLESSCFPQYQSKGRVRRQKSHVPHRPNTSRQSIIQI